LGLQSVPGKPGGKAARKITVAQAERKLTIGTRGSPLAVWQAEWVRTSLRELEPGLSISLEQIKTTGDRILDAPLAMIGGKGLFVKEIEEALARSEIDLAIHSMKDVPTQLPAGLEILSIPAREDPRDALITRNGDSLEKLPSGARIGTSSLRRQAQLLHARPDFKVALLRGNLDTRLRKLDAGDYDAILLAAAGLRRLGLEQRITEFLPYEVCLPAISQGALGLEGRADDRFVRELVARLEDRHTRIAVTAERAFLERLEGGCQVPIAAHATIDHETILLRGLIASVDGRCVIRGSAEGALAEATETGAALAERLLSQGGREILKEIYEQQ
jgi:hydroxymethylbilane synthase